MRECKWTARPAGRSVLEELRRSPARTSYGAGRPQQYELLFSRAGFTPDLLQLARTGKGLILAGPDWLVGRAAPLLGDADRNPGPPP